MLRPARERRLRGAVYTPAAIVAAMLDWAERHAAPERVIDPGAGSGRYLIAAGRRFPESRLIGVELDPLAALLARGNLAAAAGVLDRLVHYLRGASSLQGGRVYAGGLTKFEPRGMERIPVPGPELLGEPA